MPDFAATGGIFKNWAFLFLYYALSTFLLQAAELIVPLPLLEDGSYDWRIVQEVIILRCYKKIFDSFLNLIKNYR